MLNLDVIRKRIRGGFRPFTLYLSDGRSFAVPHPEFIALPKGYAFVVGDDGVGDYVDPLHIVSLKEGILTKSPAKKIRGSE